MGRDFTNFHAGCHSPVPLRRLFRGRTSRKRSRTIDSKLGTREHRISVLAMNYLHRPHSQRLARASLRLRAGPQTSDFFAAAHWPICTRAIKE